MRATYGGRKINIFLSRTPCQIFARAQSVKSLKVGLYQAWKVVQKFITFLYSTNWLITPFICNSIQRLWIALFLAKFCCIYKKNHIIIYSFHSKFWSHNVILSKTVVYKQIEIYEQSLLASTGTTVLVP